MDPVQGVDKDIPANPTFLAGFMVNNMLSFMVLGLMPSFFPKKTLHPFLLRGWGNPMSARLREGNSLI